HPKHAALVFHADDFRALRKSHRELLKHRHLILENHATRCVGHFLAAQCFVPLTFLNADHFILSTSAVQSSTETHWAASSSGMSSSPKASSIAMESAALPHGSGYRIVPSSWMVQRSLAAISRMRVGVVI